MTSSHSFAIRHAWLWLIPLSVVAAALLAEGVLRLFPELMPEEAQLNRLWNEQTPVKSVGDPYLGFVYPPHWQADFVTHDFRFKIDADEHGFRNRSPWPDRAEVVIVGDSMAYGYGVADDEAWPALLDEALPTSRVITLGLPGTSPPQYARYFERFGVALRPEVLIFAIFPGNDIVEAQTFDQWVAAGSPGNFAVWRFFKGKVPPKTTPLLERSYLLLSLRSVENDLRHGFSGTTVEFADGGRLELVPNVYASSIEHNDPTDPGYRSVIKAAVEARNRARAIGSQFVVLFFPVKESIYLPLQGAHFPGLIHPLLDDLEHDEHMPVIDLTGPFRELAAKGQRLYFAVDGHPNALGNKVVADVVAKYLRANAQDLGLEDWNQAALQSDRALPR